MPSTRAPILLHDATGFTGRLVAAELAAASLPSPEAIVTPAHTVAATGRTFLAASAPSAEMAHLFRHLLPSIARFAEPLAARVLAGGVEGPSGEARAAHFVMFGEATKARPDKVARVTVAGVDPYGVTARTLAYAAKTALAGNVGRSNEASTGPAAVNVGGEILKNATNSAVVVAPSVGYAPSASLAALGLKVTTRDA